MDIPTFTDHPDYKDSAQAAMALQQIETDNPAKMAVSTDASLATIVQNFIALQSQTNHQLLDYMAKSIAPDAANVEIAERQLNTDAQKAFLKDIACKQNLMSRQLEKSLHQQIANYEGQRLQSDLHLINTPPEAWGNMDRISDSSLKLIPEFTGDSASNENDLNIFLRNVYSQVKTSGLTEEATVNVILRKLNGSAFILADRFVQDTKTEVTVPQLVKLLESKFMISCSPLAAESQLHNLRQSGRTYAQLMATCSRLAFLATRMEKAETRVELCKIKEVSGFLMAISNNDRLNIHNENSRRQTHNLKNLNLEQMCDFLQALAAEKINYEKEPIMTAQQDIHNVEYKKYDKPRQGQRQGQPKKRQGWGQEQQAPQDKEDRSPKVFVTNNMVNVGKNACLLCGAETHHFRSEKCPYYNTQLQKSPCKWCNKGGHLHRLCRTRKQNPKFF